MNKLPLILILVASVLGVGLATYLTTTHFAIAQADASPNAALALEDLKKSSICDVSGSLSCVDVNRSRWATLSLGEERPALPLSAAVIGFFAMTGLLGLLALLGDDERRKSACALIAAATVPAIAYGLFLVYVQAVEIKSWCLFCLGIDLANLALLVLAVLAHGGGLKATLSGLSGINVPTVLLAGVVLTAGTGVAYKTYTGELDKAGLLSGQAGDLSSEPGHEAHGPGDGHNHGSHDAMKAFEDMTEEEKAQAIAESKAALTEFLASYRDLTPQEIPIAAYDASKGNASAQVTFVEFADFECPHCKQLGWFMQDIAQRYYNQVRFVFKHYPLGKACNPNMTTDMHPQACEAAVATQCARRQGAFWPFHDKTFDSQGSLNTRKLLSIADALNLDRGLFERCLESEDTWSEVKQQVAQARQLGLTGTPTVFINGRELPSVHPLAIETALRQALLDTGSTELPIDEHGIFPN
ncbi:MAG: thioredoxin domain-containing protein [Myxococcota bacterium]|nr:thioredoxin domain-containing protein [Myxococcota bacterium]